MTFKLAERVFQTEHKSDGVPFDQLNFIRKVAQCRKNPKEGPFGLPFAFASIKVFDPTEDSNPRTPES